MNRNIHSTADHPLSGIFTMRVRIPHEKSHRNSFCNIFYFEFEGINKKGGLR